MANLNGQNIGTNYKGFLNLDATTINTPLDATLRAITDGMGTSTTILANTSGVLYTSLLNTPSVSAGAVTFNCALADFFSATLVTGTPTAITLSNARIGSYVIRLIQPAGGSATVTWSTTIVWAGGSAPTLTTTANYCDIITLIYDGTTWRGVATLNFAS
tara:strand:+ start:199 stop:678 length:480 start_codon:yes stop_codon:yes gene_type:complete